MVTRSWLRHFDRSWRSSNVPEERARKREMRLQGLKRWKLHWVVALLPLLIQTSLVLFCLALLVMLFDLYRPIAYSTLVILAAGIFFFLSTTVAPALDTNAPFTCPVSNALQTLINIQWSQLEFTLNPPRLNWRSERPMCMDTDDVKVNTHLAISDRLYAATSKAVENLPVFIALFDQWVHTPNLRPRSLSAWREILPLVQPYLSNASPRKVVGLRTMARLFLCFHSNESLRGRQAVIAALEKVIGGTEESSSIEQLYLQLLRQSESDWSLACQLVPRLEADKDTLTELRWILNRVTFQQFANKSDCYWHSSVEDVIPFLCSITIYIIQHQLFMNEDHGLINSLLLVARLIADRAKEVDNSHYSINSRESQTSPGRIDGGLFVSIGDSLVPPESRWASIHELYAVSSTSDAGFKHDFSQLVILLMIGTLIADGHSDIYIYSRFVNPVKELPVLMDALWEIWKTQRVDHHLLVGIAAWLLERPSGSLFRPYENQQQRMFQGLLNAYDSCTSSAMSLMTSNALQLIEAALLSSLETAEDSKWEPQTIELRNPWLVMHIQNILRRDWCMLGSAMREAVWDQLGPLTRLDQRNPEQLEQLDRPGRQDLLVEQSPTVLKVIARLRLNLYNAKVLRLDLVTLSLFLSPRNADIFNDSRRHILELFRSTPRVHSPLPDATRLETMEFKTARVLCCDFFDSKAVGELTKWRLLASVVFPEWETLSTGWKDLLAAEFMKVEYRVDDEARRRVDWMARVTPLLEGEFNLYDFGLAKDDITYGSLILVHLRMVAMAVEHFGGERLTCEIVHELEEFLGRSLGFICDKKALRRIQTVTRQVQELCALDSLAFLFSDQT